MPDTDTIPQTTLLAAIDIFTAFNNKFNEPDMHNCDYTTADLAQHATTLSNHRINLIHDLALIRLDLDECTATLLITYDIREGDIHRIELECDTYYTIIHDPYNATTIAQP